MRLCLSYLPSWTAHAAIPSQLPLTPQAMRSLLHSSMKRRVGEGNQASGKGMHVQGERLRINCRKRAGKRSPHELRNAAVCAQRQRFPVEGRALTKELRRATLFLLKRPLWHAEVALQPRHRDLCTRSPESYDTTRHAE